MAVQVYIGGEHEHESIRNLVSRIDLGYQYGIPLGVTGVGKELVRDAKYLGLATRITAELGAHFVKTYFCDKGFERVVAGCPVPVVVAGGKKLPAVPRLSRVLTLWDLILNGIVSVTPSAPVTVFGLASKMAAN